MLVTFAHFFENRCSSIALFALYLVVQTTVFWDRQFSRRMVRKSMFFGMRVQPDFLATVEGKTIYARFRRRIWLWSITVMAAYLLWTWLSPFSAQNPIMVPIPAFAAILGCQLMLGLAHRETGYKAAAVAEPATRTVALFVENEESNPWLTVLDWLAILFPIAVPMVTASIVLLCWNRFPPGYRPEHQFTMALFAVLLGIFPSGCYFALRFGARSSDWSAMPQASRRYRTVLGLMLTFGFSGSIIQLCGPILIPLLGGRPFQYLNPFILCSMFATLGLLFVVVLLRRYLRHKLARVCGDPMSDSCWKWGYLYYNPTDSAVIVPSRTGIGFSLNNARGTVWFFYATCAAVTLAALLFICSDGLW